MFQPHTSPAGESNLAAPATLFRLCVDCGDPIPAIRLSAKPHARRCVPCQSKQDVILSERPTNMTRLGYIADGRGDDDAPTRRFHIAHGSLTELMGEPESTPGQAKNTRHRVISPQGRQKMSEMSHARRN